MSNALQLSDEGLALLTGFEQFRARKYRDQGGRLTQGWGHLVKPGDNLPDVMSLEFGHQLLLSDLQGAVAEVNRTVTYRVPLLQHQFDALVIFVFNVGAAAFRNSTLLQRLLAQDFEAAAAQFDRWRFVTVDGAQVESEGLIRRRAAERAVFERGDYSCH